MMKIENERGIELSFDECFEKGILLALVEKIDNYIVEYDRELKDESNS